MAIVPCIFLAMTQPAAADKPAANAPLTAKTQKAQKSATNAAKKKTNAKTAPRVEAQQTVAKTPVTTVAPAATTSTLTAAMPDAVNATATTIAPFVFMPPFATQAPLQTPPNEQEMTVKITPSAEPFIAYAPAPWSPRPNPYIVQPITVTMAPATPVAPATEAITPAGWWQTPANASVQAKVPTATPLNEASKGFGLGSILPTIKKVYPTGERPMVIVSFNCPTQALGITSPTTKAIRFILDSGFSAINSTDLLPWTLQQVCS